MTYCHCGGIWTMSVVEVIGSLYSFQTRKNTTYRASFVDAVVVSNLLDLVL